MHQLKTLDQQRQTQVTQALLTGEENERGRLARDLHDGLGGMLAGVKLDLSRVAGEKDVPRGELHKAVDRLGKAVYELRGIARNLMSESITRSGLESALRDLCENSASPQLKIIFNAFGIQEHIAPGTQVMIYRIVQEILSNAIKHSGASKMMVQCSQEEDTFFLTVEDNGSGFDTSKKDNTGMGLNNIQNRVSFLNGTMHIDSSGDGTAINIELHVAT